MKALDSSAKTTDMAAKIVEQGYQAVGIYLRADRCSAAMVTELQKAGLKIWSMYEKGYPTHDEYFTAQQGDSDGRAAAAFAKKTLKQPAGTQIYATVDYDPDHNDPHGPTINGPISAYMRAFKAAIASDYVPSVYGSGRTCRILIANGLAQSGWLTLSTSFAEHDAFAPHAAIVQLEQVTQNWDSDEIQQPQAAGLW